MSARICPRSVAGLHCHAWRSQSRRCICEVHRAVLDHARIGLDARGHVLTAEPYGVDGEDLAAFIADVHALGLRVMVSGASSWYPGSTFLIEVTRAVPAESGWRAALGDEPRPAA